MEDDDRLMLLRKGMDATSKRKLAGTKGTVMGDRRRVLRRNRARRYPRPLRVAPHLLLSLTFDDPACPARAPSARYSRRVSLRLDDATECSLSDLGVQPLPRPVVIDHINDSRLRFERIEAAVWSFRAACIAIEASSANYRRAMRGIDR